MVRPYALPRTILLKTNFFQNSHHKEGEYDFERDDERLKSMDSGNSRIR